LGTPSCTLIMLHQLCSARRVPARKCSSISTRHLAMSQVCRKAMFLTDKKFVICMHQSLIFYSNFFILMAISDSWTTRIFCVVISPLLTFDFKLDTHFY
jgi:hypothetical protein